MEREKRERQSLYIIGWMLPLAVIAYKIFNYFTGKHMYQLMLPCFFHEFTGLYCPGCGGTRAVELLLSGHLLASFYYHPLVLYGGGLYLWFMFSNTVEFLSKERINIGMRYRKWYVVLGIVILILNFVIKNGAMLIWHYPMIG